MCMQCVTGAAVAATAGAAGLRAWLGSRKRKALPPRALRLVTAVIVTAGVIAAGLSF